MAVRRRDRKVVLGQQMLKQEVARRRGGAEENSNVLVGKLVTVGLGNVKSHLHVLRNVILAAVEDGVRSGWVHATEVRHSPTRGGQNSGVLVRHSLTRGGQNNGSSAKQRCERRTQGGNAE